MPPGRGAALRALLLGVFLSDEPARIALGIGETLVDSVLHGVVPPERCPHGIGLEVARANADAKAGIHLEPRLFVRLLPLQHSRLVAAERNGRAGFRGRWRGVALRDRGNDRFAHRAMRVDDPGVRRGGRLRVFVPPDVGEEPYVRREWDRHDQETDDDHAEDEAGTRGAGRGAHGEPL